MIPKIDSDIGILHYTTKFQGCGGKIRERFEDFAVSEVLEEKTLNSLSSDDGFAVYRLTKSGIDTNHALERIYKQFGVRLKALGLKDASAVTEQYVCSVAKNKRIRDYSDEKITLQSVGSAKKPLSAKDMVGNRFKIKITNPSSDPSGFAEHDRVLNFYGYQRFGSKRAMTHLVGKALVQKRFSDAVSLILSFVSEYDSAENSKIRLMLGDPANYRQAISQIPKQMDLEIILLKEMVEHSDPKRAFTKLPLSIRRFFVEAYQSYLFNLTLSRSYEYGEDLFVPHENDVCYDRNSNLGKFQADPQQLLAVPTVGHSYFKKTRFDFHITKILQQEEIAPKDFYIKEMQEISSEGGFRGASIRCKDFSACSDMVSFTLSRGSFATMVLREIIKPQSPLESGF